MHTSKKHPQLIPLISHYFWSTSEFRGILHGYGWKESYMTLFTGTMSLQDGFFGQHGSGLGKGLHFMKGLKKVRSDDISSLKDSFLAAVGSSLYHISAYISISFDILEDTTLAVYKGIRVGSKMFASTQRVGSLWLEHRKQVLWLLDPFWSDLTGRCGKHSFTYSLYGSMLLTVTGVLCIQALGNESEK